MGTRVLVLGWCLWLLGTWIVLWVIGGWTVPALRAMVLWGMVGFMGLWPAVRLSQPTGRWASARSAGGSAAASGDRDVDAVEWARACRQTLLDWFCLNLVFQAVLWPLQIAARWSLAQTLWLDLSVAGWSLLTGLLIAWGRGTDRGLLRSWTMLACVGLVVLEPLLWWAGWQAGVVGTPTMRLSPLQALWGFSDPGLNASGLGAVARTLGVQAISITAAAAAGWVVLLGLIVLQLMRRRRASAGPDA
jgi:hypothetical protein